VREYRNEESGLIRLFIDSVDKLFSENKKEKIHIGGTKNILSQPEFEDTRHFKSIIELMENQDIIIHVLENREGNLKVTIGKENNSDDLKDFSLVSANYSAGDLSGSIGILGPKRMNYSKMIPLVDFVATTISAMLQPTNELK
ncbi:MAG: HrcA family transcriptional regulator, partial [Bacteroidota bacterium]